MRNYYIFSSIKGSNGQRKQCLDYSSFEAFGILFLFFTLNLVFIDRVVNKKHLNILPVHGLELSKTTYFLGRRLYFYTLYLC